VSKARFRKAREKNSKFQNPNFKGDGLAMMRLEFVI
jgi:hypothetical protein